METTIPIFNASMDDMKDLVRYVNKLEQWNAHRWGIVKIIPPSGWTPRPNDPNYEDHFVANYKIPLPILTQSFVETTQKNIYTVYADRKKIKKSTDVPGWARLYSSNPTKILISEDDYWNNVESLSPQYGADIPGSLFQDDYATWNLKMIPNILWHMFSIEGLRIQGILTPSLYFGTAGSTFACHTEDSDLYSINYLHTGQPKTWRGIPPAYCRRVENLLSELYPQDFQRCSGAGRHKFALLHPKVLQENYNIPSGCVSQI